MHVGSRQIHDVSVCDYCIHYHADKGRYCTESPIKPLYERIIFIKKRARDAIALLLLIKWEFSRIENTFCSICLDGTACNQQYDEISMPICITCFANARILGKKMLKNITLAKYLLMVIPADVAGFAFGVYVRVLLEC